MTFRLDWMIADGGKAIVHRSDWSVNRTNWRIVDLSVMRRTRRWREDQKHKSGKAPSPGGIPRASSWP
ncbi:hypothetical protein, partial [Acinetobacter sp. MB5]|uniref:hypothetical protein n=1 Tax=Acinetobacter sp. MB5 TaxID=2069438 RepID=UPI00196AA73E